MISNRKELAGEVKDNLGFFCYACIGNLYKKEPPPRANDNIRL